MIKPDLNKLKAEIDNRKKEKGIISSKLGESTGMSVPARDEFLNGLLTSLHTGKSNTATNLIKLVENKTAEKKREGIIHNNVNPILPTAQNVVPLNHQSTAHNNDLSQDRDELLWEEIERRKKQTLTEQIEGYANPTGNLHTQKPQTNLNEGYLVENVKKVVDNYLIENFGPVVEEAIKSTILEMYAIERIKEVLQENKEMVKTIVIEVIKDIQAKNKAKAR